MFGTFDLETRGLHGPLSLGGSYDGKTFSFHDSIDSLLDWMTSHPQPAWYAHNLEFDLSHVLTDGREHPKIIWSKSVWINRKPVKILLQWKNTTLEMRDSYALIPTSLDSALSSFGVATQKLHIEGDKGKYFDTVDINDPTFRKYLRNDVIGLWELVDSLINSSALEPEEFMKAITAPSLSMRVFKSLYPETFKEITQPMGAEIEYASRLATYGGRTEVFQMFGENLLHYDVNSLYPDRAINCVLPYGDSRMDIDPDKLPIKRPYIAKISVKTPDHMDIPLLPVRTSDKLIFPLGEFTGSWCSPEIEEAIKRGYTIKKIHHVVTWSNYGKVFAPYMESLMLVKESTTGAQKETAKLLANSFIGKWGQSRERDAYRESDLNPSFIYGGVGIEEVEESSWTPTMQPHLNAFITSEARLKLWKTMQMILDNGGHVWYCDTDSIVTDTELPRDIVNPKSCGMWKLEARVHKAIFASPKLYAESRENEEETTVKAKGVPRERIARFTIEHVTNIANAVLSGESIQLYEPVEDARPRLLSSLMQGNDPHGNVIRKANMNPFQNKRVFTQDGKSMPTTVYMNNDGVDLAGFSQREKYLKSLARKIIELHGIIPDGFTPDKFTRKRATLSLHEIAEACGCTPDDILDAARPAWDRLRQLQQEGKEQAAQRSAAARARREARRELVARVRELGGVKPSSDFNLPNSVIRRASGIGLNEMADMLGFETDDDLYQALTR